MPTIQKKSSGRKLATDRTCKSSIMDVLDSLFEADGNEHADDDGDDVD
jgi:hypothetical protein